MTYLNRGNKTLSPLEILRLRRQLPSAQIQYYDQNMGQEEELKLLAYEERLRYNALVDGFLAGNITSGYHYKNSGWDSPRQLYLHVGGGHTGRVQPECQMSYISTLRKSASFMYASRKGFNNKLGMKMCRIFRNRLLKGERI